MPGRPRCQYTDGMPIDYPWTDARAGGTVREVAPSVGPTRAFHRFGVIAQG